MDGSLGEGSVRRRGRMSLRSIHRMYADYFFTGLSVRELASLFGIKI